MCCSISYQNRFQLQIALTVYQIPSMLYHVFLRGRTFWGDAVRRHTFLFLEIGFFFLKNYLSKLISQCPSNMALLFEKHDKRDLISNFVNIPNRVLLPLHCAASLATKSSRRHSAIHQTCYCSIQVLLELTKFLPLQTFTSLAHSKCSGFLSTYYCPLFGT